jgi:hypothetical protein
LAKQETSGKKLVERVDSFFKADSKIYDEMERYMKRYKGEWWSEDLDEDDSKIHANYIFSTVETVAPLLTDNRPIWSVRARQSFMQNHMEAFSLATEYLWDKLGMDDISYRWVKDALIMKVGIVKVYWDKTEDPDGRGDPKGEIAIDNVDPRTFFIAPGYKRLKDAPMCGEKMSKPLSWIRFKYPKKFKEVTAAMGSPNLDNMQDWEIEGEKQIVYEIWMRDSAVEEYYVDDQGKQTKEKTDRKKTRELFPNGKIVVLTKGGVVLDERPSPFKHGMCPYVELYDITVPHEFWGMSEPDQIEEMNLSFNSALQLMHRWMKNYADPTWIVDPSSGLEADKVRDQLKKGGGVMEATFTGAQRPMEKMEAPAINQTVPMLMTAIQRLIEEVSGVTDVSKGQVGKSQRQSATEISTLIESAYTRTRQRVRNYESSTGRLLYMIISMMQQFYTQLREFQVDTDGGPQRATISNRQDFASAAVGIKDGQETPQENEQIDRDVQRFMKEFGTVDPIYAAFDITLDTNSSLPMDKQSKANMFLRLLEMASGNPATSMPIWKATLETLRVPKFKRIIQEMEQGHQQMMQAQSPQQPGPPVSGPPPVSQLQGGGQQ